MWKQAKERQREREVPQSLPSLGFFQKSKALSNQSPHIPPSTGLPSPSTHTHTHTRCQIPKREKEGLAKGNVLLSLSPWVGARVRFEVRAGQAAALLLLG